VADSASIEMAAYKSSGPIDCSVKPDLSKVKGRTAIVTGGASGIGRAYVRSLSKAGAYVVIADIDSKAGQEAQSEFPETSAFVKCDVLSWQEQLSAFKKALELAPHGQIDIVIANAGIGGGDTLSMNDLSKDEPEEPKLRTLEINLKGVFYTVKLALWYFQKQESLLPEGHKRDRNLILQASMAGYIDIPTPQYSASKFGVRGLMRALRHIVPQYGVRVNVIAPWYIKTAILDASMVNLIEEVGAGWATVESCAAAVERIVTDEKIQARSFAIVPQDWKGGESGFMDLDQDDFDARTWMGEKQTLCLKPIGMAVQVSLRSRPMRCECRGHADGMVVDGCQRAEVKIGDIIFTVATETKQCHSQGSSIRLSSFLMRFSPHPP
jgi:NAD(P)-dependent dehydrogenase (short-subunit alcohol dehydrogenase family)